MFLTNTNVILYLYPATVTEGSFLCPGVPTFENTIPAQTLTFLTKLKWFNMDVVEREWILCYVRKELVDL